MKTRRITLSISGNIESIKKQIQDEHGIEYSYAQVLDYLIHYYRKHAQQPKTEWRRP